MAFMNNGSNHFTDANGATKQTLVTAGVNGAIIRAIIATTDNGITARKVNLYINDGSTDRQLAAVSIPINSGTNGVAAPVAVLSTRSIPGQISDSNGGFYLTLKATWLLKANLDGNCDAGKTLNLLTFAEDI